MRHFPPDYRKMYALLPLPRALAYKNQPKGESLVVSL